MSQALEFGAVILARSEHGPFDGLNRRSLHPIDQLSRRLDWVCTTATDPLQIAAALESDGVNDRIAREEYGFADVFELAEELYRRVPLRPLEKIDLAPEPPRQTLLTLVRGVLVVPVGLLAVALSGLGQRTVTLGTMLAAALIWLGGFAWGLVRPLERNRTRTERRTPRQDWPEVAVFGALGLIVLLWLPMLYWARNQASLSLGLLLCLLPLSICAGLLDWSLTRFKRHAARLLARYSQASAFVQRQRLVFLGWLGVFMVWLVLASLLAWEFIPRPGWIGTRTAPMLIANLAFGAALFSSFLLIARGRVRLLFAPWVTVLIAFMVSSLLRLPHGLMVFTAIGSGIVLMIWTVGLCLRTLGSVAD